MRQAAADEGVSIHLISAFRSLEYQQQLIERKIQNGQSIDTILAVNAAPGFSEHHSGRAIDVGTPNCDALVEAFEHTEAYAWLQRRAAEFGFSLSFPRDNPHGIAYEPWHWCFEKTDSEV
jgi:D-alanyl-D-alanine carboxypeptidase